MNKNDKLIAVIGVVILVIASIGIYYWEPDEEKERTADIVDFVDVSGVFSNTPDAVSVSDSSPFYALIATPLAVNYDAEGVQHVIPLYVKDSDELSHAVERVESQIGISIDEVIDDSKSVKESSLYIAKKHWESSDAVLLIKNNEIGYSLGVVAAPLASYLSIPIIVSDELDVDVKEVLQDLGVKYSFVCGDIEGYGDYIKFDDVDDTVNVSIKLLMKKFGDIGYITLANPRDAWPPEVLDKKTISFDGTVKSMAIFPSNVINIISTFFSKEVEHVFEIPEDFKYALVKVDLKNLEDPEYIEKFSDDIVVDGSLTAYTRTIASPAKRDINGNIENDRFYYETILYDMGGEEYDIKLTGNFHTLKQVNYELRITIEKLSNPYYPMMKQFSSIAPYLTAYHRGIVFAKPEFAFAADDDKLLDGNTLPGTTTAKLNPLLIPVINRHVFENIHEPLNDLLAKITDITSTEYLTKHCKIFPFYIALVGDTIMLPQYYYRSPHNDPFYDPGLTYGTNVPSDFIYGNVDPEAYFMQPHTGLEDVENDLYSNYPEVENIVGRITGWDIQDASALIARTIFYEDIIEKMGSWKDNAVIMSGAGLEFQKIPIFNTIYNLLGHRDPMKFPSGEQHFVSMRLDRDLEKGGFDTVTTERGQSQRIGYSDEALWDIKHDGLLNRLFFPRLLVKLIQGFDSVHSLSSLKWWREAFSGGSSIKGGELQENSNMILSHSHAIWFSLSHGDIMLYASGGPPILYQILARFVPIISFRTPLNQHGGYSVRSVENMNMGPSIMFIEGCGSGKIDSLHPTNTISNAYLHAGVNAFISPTTFSAIGGYLEPRPKWPLFPNGVGLGILGYLNAAKNAKNGIYPPVHFCFVIFEKAYNKMFEENVDIGRALRDAKNAFLPEQANVTYLWTPPLTYTETTGGGGDRVIVEKYSTIYQLNLLGDPAFNPYEPCNEGGK